MFAPMLLAMTIAQPVPSASEVLLAEATTCRARLAQATQRDPDLDRDVLRSRYRKLRKEMANGPVPVPARQNDQPSSAEPIASDAQPPTAEATGSVPPLTPCPQPIAYQVTRDGRTKAYYIGWSVADWIIAGNMWVAGGFMGFVTLGLAIEAATNPWDDGSGTAAVFTGLITAGLITTGAVLASRGSGHLATYRDMLAEELYLGRTPEPPSE